MLELHEGCNTVRKKGWHLQPYNVQAQHYDIPVYRRDGEREELEEDRKRERERERDTLHNYPSTHTLPPPAAHPNSPYLSTLRTIHKLCITISYL